MDLGLPGVHHTAREQDHIASDPPLLPGIPQGQSHGQGQSSGEEAQSLQQGEDPAHPTE